MKEESSINRRAFIKSAAFWGGLSLMLGLSRSAAAKTKKPVSRTPVQQNKGYRLTEHVKKYYEAAKF